MFKFLKGAGRRSGQPSDCSSVTCKRIFTGNYCAFTAFDRYVLRTLVRSIDKPFKRIAEIGSWTGNGSTKTIVEEFHGRGGLLYCIDHWQGNPGVQGHNDLVAKFDMFGTFRFNVSSFHGDDVVKPLAMSSKDAAKIIKDSYFDMVFIDGDHAYDSTKADIEMWFPKVAEGGILCGHDCEARLDGKLDRNHLWSFKSEDTIEGNREFPRIHPGVILAVGEKFGRSVRLWSETSITLDNGEVGRSTIWDIAVRRN